MNAVAVAVTPRPTILILVLLYDLYIDTPQVLSFLHDDGPDPNTTSYCRHRVPISWRRHQPGEAVGLTCQWEKCLE